MRRRGVRERAITGKLPIATCGSHGFGGCGNGAPMWFQQKAVDPAIVGKPLETKLPYRLIDEISVYKVDGYDHCGDDAEKWAQFAGDPNYNLLNECCLAMVRRR